MSSNAELESLRISTSIECGDAQQAYDEAEIRQHTSGADKYLLGRVGLEKRLIAGQAVALMCI